jgi:hypothetical protein
MEVRPRLQVPWVDSLDCEEVDGQQRGVLRALPPRQLKSIEEERDLLRINLRDYRTIVDNIVGSASYRLGRALTLPWRALRAAGPRRRGPGLRVAAAGRTRIRPTRSPSRS